MPSKGFSIDWLKEKGLEETSPGVYEHSSKEVAKIAGGKELIINTAKQPVINTPDFSLNKPVESFLTIEGIVLGLNGSKGLMRAHWSSRKKIKDLYRSIVKEHLRTNKVRRHEGKVTVTFIGYKSSFFDWDNFGSSFKHIGDALVAEKVLLDDSPKVIVNFIPKQIKCKRSEQRVVVIIQDAI